MTEKTIEVTDSYVIIKKFTKICTTPKEKHEFLVAQHNIRAEKLRISGKLWVRKGGATQNAKVS